MTPRKIAPRTRGAEPWYAKGLHFQCARCGRCCTGAPGYVWLDPVEVRRMARFLDTTPSRFKRQHCRRVLCRISLLERANGDCIFFTPAGCRIYPVRPAQCRSFPFWKGPLGSPREWEALRARCPGVGKGKLYTRQEIEDIRDGSRSTG